MHDHTPSRCDSQQAWASLSEVQKTISAFSWCQWHGHAFFVRLCDAKLHKPQTVFHLSAKTELNSQTFWATAEWALFEYWQKCCEVFCFSSGYFTKCTDLGLHALKMLPKIHEDKVELWLILAVFWRHARETKTKDNLPTIGQICLTALNGKLRMFYSALAFLFHVWQ